MIYLYYPDSMAFFGERACRLFGWERKEWPELYNPDEKVIFWLYSPFDYTVFVGAQCKKYILWMGSDALIALRPAFAELLRDYPAVHACMGQTQADWLKLIGINSIVRPFFFSDPARYKPVKQIKELQDIYTNVNEGREQEYGLIHFLQAAQNLPEKRFHVFGVKQFIPLPNVTYYGRLSEPEYDLITDAFDLYVMGHINAGFPQSAAKAQMRGQFVVSINPDSFYADYFDNARQLIALIDRNEINKREQRIINQTDWL